MTPRCAMCSATGEIDYGLMCATCRKQDEAFTKGREKEGGDGHD